MNHDWRFLVYRRTAGFGSRIADLAHLYPDDMTLEEARRLMDRERTQRVESGAAEALQRSMQGID